MQPANDSPALPRINPGLRTGKSHRDLYYRLNTVRIVLAPLRARPDDILLAEAGTD